MLTCEHAGEAMMPREAASALEQGAVLVGSRELRALATAARLLDEILGTFDLEAQTPFAEQVLDRAREVGLVGDDGTLTDDFVAGLASIGSMFSASLADIDIDAIADRLPATGGVRLPAAPAAET